MVIVLRNRVAVAITVVLALTVAFAAACGPGDGDAADPASTTVAARSAAPDPEDLDEALARQGDVPVRIVFDVRSDERMTFAIDGEDVSLRTDDRYFLVPASADPVACEEGDGEELSCYSYAPDSVLAFNSLLVHLLRNATVDLGPVTGDVVADTIADRPVLCADVELSSALVDAAQSFAGQGLSDDATARVCIDEMSGFLLSWRLESADMDAVLELVAVEVSSPTDEDFEPPGPVADLTDADIEFPEDCCDGS